MNKSRASAEPPPAKPPEFFLDRCLGKEVARLLRERQWIVHQVSELFPDDGQSTTDEEWIAFGLTHDWGLLTQDKRIRYRSKELAALGGGKGVMFCLTQGNLLIRERVARFDASRPAIYRAASASGPALYWVYETDIKRKWP